MSDETTPKWLTDIQNNSWEPEIILSGLTITFLFIMNEPLYNFFAKLIQDYGLIMMGELGFVFACISLNAVIVVLLFHLILRGLWVGMIGLSYVYPQGITRANLPKHHREGDFDNAMTFVIKIERICSLLFSFIFSVILTFVLIILVYSPIALIEITLSGSTLQKPLIIAYAFLIAIPPSIMMTKFANHPWVKKINNHVYSCLIYTIQTNTGSRSAFVLFGVLIVFSLPLSIAQIQSFKQMRDESLRETESSYAVIYDRHYLDKRNTSLRLAKTAIDQFEVSGDSLILNIAYYKQDELAYNSITTQSKPQDKEHVIVDLAIWKQQGLAALFDLSINDKPIKTKDWHVFESQQLGQNIYQLRLNISHLDKGKYQLKLNKWALSKQKMHYQLRENWDSLLFYKK